MLTTSRRYLALLVAGAVLVSGCSSEIGSGDAESTSASESSAPESTASETTAPQTAGTDADFRDDDFGISFDLPESFSKEDDPGFLFAARSNQPRAFFTIDAEVGDALTRGPLEGETQSELDFGTGGAILVDNAAVTGLSPGFGAKALVVDNGPRTFGVIMSASEDDLDELWATFIDSLSVTDA